jgi:hypothetical protein
MKNCNAISRYSVERMAPACLYLAAKVEEQPQPIQSVLEIFHYMTCARQNKAHLSLCELPDALVGEKRADLTKMESLLLTQLGFIIHTELPYKFLCAYLDFLGLRANGELAQRAWNYANDLLRSDACVRHDAPTLACSCIHLAAADISLPLPFEPPWWTVFNVSDVDIACVTMILQQLLDMPKAFNVLEPPPLIATKEGSNNPETQQHERSRAVNSAFSSAAEGSLGAALSRRDDTAHGEAQGDRSCLKEHGGGAYKSNSRRDNGVDDRSCSSGYHRGDAYRDDRSGGSEQRRSYSRDDGRHADQEYRRDDDREDGRGRHRRGRDSSRERHRDDYGERSDARHGDRRDDRRDFSHDRREDRDVSSSRAASGLDASEASLPVSRDHALSNSSQSNASDVADASVLKASRRAGRWDES